MDLSYFEESYDELVTPAQYDELGNETAPAVYETLTRFRTRPETKARADVERVKALGKSSAVIEKFVALYLEGVQWDWFADYQQWEQDKAEVEQWNADNAGDFTDDDGNDYTVEAKVLPVEPVRPAVETVADWIAANKSREELKLEGFDYNGVTVPVGDDDALGALQLEAGFERMGMQDSVFRLSNGGQLPLTAAEWPAFKAAFFTARAALFQ